MSASPTRGPSGRLASTSPSRTVPTAIVLRVSGELDLVSEPQLNHALEQLDGRDGHARPLRAGVHGLDRPARAARRRAHVPELKLQGPLQPPVQRLLELTQTLTILPFK